MNSLWIRKPPIVLKSTLLDQHSLNSQNIIMIKYKGLLILAEKYIYENSFI